MTQRPAEPLRIRSSLLEAHRAQGPDPADIQRAYLRFSWARRKAPHHLPVVRWLLAGVAVGFGVASAATLIRPPNATTPAPRESATVVAPAAKHHRVEFGGRSTAVEQPPAQAAPIAAPSERPPLSTRPSSSAFGADLHAGTLPSASLPSASQWQRAAAALRDGDLPNAEAALAELEHSPSLHERQAAELARAQLLVRGGRVGEAIPTLQRLAHEGDSPVIRSQAAALLDTFN